MKRSIPKRFCFAMAIMVYTFISALFGVNLEGIIAILCPLVYLLYMKIDKYEEIDIDNLYDRLSYKLIDVFKNTQ